MHIRDISTPHVGRWLNRVQYMQLILVYILDMTMSTFPKQDLANAAKYFDAL